MKWNCRTDKAMTVEQINKIEDAEHMVSAIRNELSMMIEGLDAHENRLVDNVLYKLGIVSNKLKRIKNYEDRKEFKKLVDTPFGRCDSGRVCRE